MSGFFTQARDAAAAEYGRRNYRTFAFLAWARRALPALSSVAVAAVVVASVGGAAAVRGSWLPYVPQVVVVLAVAGGVGLLVAAAVWGWRNRWRWGRW